MPCVGLFGFQIGEALWPEADARQVVSEVRSDRACVTSPGQSDVTKL